METSLYLKAGYNLIHFDEWNRSIELGKKWIEGPMAVVFRLDCITTMSTNTWYTQIRPINLKKITQLGIYRYIYNVYKKETCNKVCRGNSRDSSAFKWITSFFSNPLSMVTTYISLTLFTLLLLPFVVLPFLSNFYICFI